MKAHNMRVFLLPVVLTFRLPLELPENFLVYEPTGEPRDYSYNETDPAFYETYAYDPYAPYAEKDLQKLLTLGNHFNSV